MKHCCHHLALALLSALLVLPSALHADVIIMKDGKKYVDATVLSETADTVTFEYVVVAKIKDTRTEPKSAVAQVIRQKPEETEIVALRKLLPTPDLLTADKYESLIQDQVRPFVTKYAGTPQATEAEGIIKTLQDEKEKVTAGSLKMEGQWLSPDMAKRDAHSIDAYRVRRDLKEFENEGKLREALIEWQKMSDPNDGYTDTLQYVKAIPEVLDLLTAYKKQLDRMILEQPSLLKRRTDSLTKMLPTDPILARTKKAIDAEVLAFNTETAVEKKSRVRWMSVYKYDLKSLQLANKVVIDEMARLRILDINKLTTQNEALVSATRYLADGNVEQTEAALQRAAAVGLSVANKAVQNLRNQLVTLKKEQNAKRHAKTVYGTGNINAITNTGTVPATDSRVAEALEAAAKAKAEKSDAKEGGKAEPADGTEKAGKPPLASTEATDAEPAAGAKGEANPSTTHHKDKPKHHTPSSSTTPLATTPTPEEGGVSTKIVMAGGGLLAVLLTVMFLQKRKNKAA